MSDVGDLFSIVSDLKTGADLFIVGDEGLDITVTSFELLGRTLASRDRKVGCTSELVVHNDWSRR